MNIILNSYCNLKCNYCFADEYMEETVNTPGKSMDFDYFEKELLPRIQKAGVINFMGGEPTLHPRFNEMLSMTLDAMSPYSNLGLRLVLDAPDESEAKNDAVEKFVNVCRTYPFELKMLVQAGTGQIQRRKKTFEP